MCRSKRAIAIGAVAVLALCVAGRVMAQQPVSVTNIAYDPCADPSKVQTYRLNEGAATGTIEIVSVFASTRVYLCNAKFQGGAAGFTIVAFGTGSLCGTGTDNLDVSTFTGANTPTISLTSGGGNATFARSDTAHALCLYRDSSMTLTGYFRYVQE